MCLTLTLLSEINKMYLKQKDNPPDRRTPYLLRSTSMNHHKSSKKSMLASHGAVKFTCSSFIWMLFLDHPSLHLPRLLSIAYLISAKSQFQVMQQNYIQTKQISLLFLLHFIICITWLSFYFPKICGYLTVGTLSQSFFISFNRK